MAFTSFQLEVSTKPVIAPDVRLDPCHKLYAIAGRHVYTVAAIDASADIDLVVKVTEIATL